MTGFLDTLRDHALADPERIALDPVIGDPLTYQTLVLRVAELADRLRREHLPTRPVALRLDHGVDLALLELALLEAELPVLSLPTFFTLEQGMHAMNACGAAALYPSSLPGVGATPYRTNAVELPPLTARITFTSGSTGTPKGVCLSASHMLAVAGSVVDAVGAEHAGRHLALLPSGILLETVAGMYATLLAGGTYVCPNPALAGLADPFGPDYAIMAARIADWRINSLILVPEYLEGLVEVLETSGLRLPHLTLVAVGGARTGAALIGRARALGLPVRQGYGLTECGSVVSLEDAGGGEAGSAGRPLGHMAARIADDGEVILDGPLCLGTIGDPREPGPFATGDIGRIDASGRLWIEGRKSNLVVTSFGRNISPEWVEEVLLAQPAIAQAMVHGDGLPAPEALLVPSRRGADLAQAVADANALLPAYARVVRWRETLPFTPANGLLTANGRLRREAIAGAHLDDLGIFSAELEAATLSERLGFLAVPQVQAGLRGDISLPAYIAYLTEAWHHVRHTVPLLRAARRQLGHRAELAAALDQYIDEEIGHDDWILADIDAAGGQVDLVKVSRPAAATRAMVKHAYDRVSHGNPVSLFGMIYVLESVSIALAERGAEAVASKLGLPPEAFTYLTSHGALDQDHMRFFAEVVNGLTSTADRSAIIEMAKEMFGLFGGVFASIALEGENVAA